MRREPDSAWSLLAKYLVNEATDEERLSVEMLLKSNEDLRNDFKRLAIAYYFSHNSEQVDPIQFFDKLSARIKKPKH